MQRAWIDRLASPRTGAPLELDAIRTADDELVEGFLVSKDEREVWPLIAGVAVLPRDLSEHLAQQGNVYRRSPINDPRLARFLLGRAGTGYVVVPFEEVVGHYRDLASEPPEGYDTSPHPEHVALRGLLAATEAGGVGAFVGSGVGRGVFSLCEQLDAVLGIDRSIACVRRSRNIAVTVEAFFLPAPKGSGLKEIPLDFAALTRTGADFVLGDPEALPLRDGVVDVLVLHGADSLGPWSDADAAWAEAWRVTVEGGWLVWHESLPSASLPSPVLTEGPWRAARRP